MLTNKNDASGLRGTLTRNAPLGARSWFRCGGNADLLFEPADPDDLQAFLQRYDHTKPLITLGGMANTIVRDGGVRGGVILMGKGMRRIEVRDDHHIYAEAGTLNGTIAARAMKAGTGGLAFLSGIPGTLGGAVAMNAGAYGREIKDVLVEVHTMDLQGHMHVMYPEDLNMSYRHTSLPAYMIITGAVLKGHAETPDRIKTRMNEIKTARNETQPIQEKTGGSTFANPWPSTLKHCGLPPDTKAWQIIDQVGGRGLQIGGAKMSEQHCNFMINTGEATAGDLEALGEEIRTRAVNEFGLTLRWEIKRIGEKIL